MTMTERLLEATKEIWDGYNETPFVKGIADDYGETVECI